jgi:RNA polymerase primary sigma factor
VTGAGKTRLGLEAVRNHLSTNRRNAKAVIVVPTIELMLQWREALGELLPTTKVALLGGGEVGTLVDGDVLIAVVNSAARGVPEQARIVATTRPVLLVADECHRLGAETFSTVLDAPYAATLGLSATPVLGAGRQTRC